MTPTVTIGNCQLYLADCMDVLPTLGKVDAVVTDPPYGIGFNYAGSYKDVGGEAYLALLSPFSDFPRVMLHYPEEMMRYMAPLWGAPDDVYAWCYNSNTNRQFRLWGFWGIRPDWDSVKQPCKNPGDPRVSGEVRSYDWCSDLQQVKNVSAEKTGHPCQVPVDLMRRIVSLTKAQTIFDPFMGSGTTGVACVKMGRKFIGIEREPEYFDIACRRIEEAYKQPDMFIAPPSPMKQESLL